ncbi:MAG: hypothetical protein M1504_03025 [Candidatus Marsarchaeota archaeon]|nr:hypothetical protein [Candidatus Marsarchaeota archaeon]
MLDAIDSRLKESSVSNNSLSFGIREYIDIAGVKYDPKIGMLGMNVNITFQRKGRRVEIRKIRVSKIPKKHGVVTRDEIKDYMKKEYKVEFV